MKKMFFYFLLFIFFLGLSGCMSTVMKDVWTQNPQYRWYVPAVVYGAEEASANLKNCQDSVLINNRQPAEISVDRYSLRATMRWQEIEEKKDVVNYSGGYFWGWDYVPTFGSAEQITNITHDKQDTAIVTFKDIDNIVVMDNAVYVNMEGGKTIGFVSRGGLNLQKLADSMYSLARSLGKKLKLDAGFSYSKMSQKQAQELGMDSGIYVPWVFRGSPAVKSGLEANDVIIEVDGEKITRNTNIDDMVAALIADASKKGYFNMTVMHWERAGKGDIKWEKRALKIYPVER